MKNCYAEWLKKRGWTLFKGVNAYWQLYRGALIPATTAPCFIGEMDPTEAKSLLKESGAWFLRFSSDPCEEETSWWYTVCDKCDPQEFSSNTRSKINRSRKRCSVERVSAEWLAEHGYPCYVAAHSRYKGAVASSQERFRKNILNTIGGPFEHWGVFVEKNLSGYCQCVIEENNVATNVIKFDPDHLKNYISYALMSHLINHYVVERSMVISNGTRSIAHDTNIQDFLLKLGFRKQYCRLNIMYRPWVEVGARVIFPFRQLIARLPDTGSLSKLQTFLAQEELRRQCR